MSLFNQYFLPNDSINANYTIFHSEYNQSFSEKSFFFEDNDYDMNLKLQSFMDLNQFDLEKQITSQNTYLLKKTKRDDNINDDDNNILKKDDSKEKLEKINVEDELVPVPKEEKNVILENKINPVENLQKIKLNELPDNNTISQGKIQIEIEKEKILEDNKDNNDNNKKNKAPKYGRKTDKEKKNGNNGKHTKKDKDNQMRKIKSFFGKSIYKYLKSSFIEETDLLKLEIDINKNLKRDFNLLLFKRTLKDIYSKSNISYKYKLKNVETNEALINKIYKEKKEIEVIKILNLTYGEIFEIFRQKLTLKPLSSELKSKIQGINILNKERFYNVEIFLKKIREEEKKKGESKKDIEEYIEDIKSLIIGFEDWFSNKIGRDRD